MQTKWDSSWLDSGNQSYLDSQFETFLKDPTALPAEWRDYFQELISANSQYMDVSHADVQAFFKNINTKPKSHKTLSITNAEVSVDLLIEKLIFSYRLLGHLQSTINPIYPNDKIPVPELELQFHGLDANHLTQTFNPAGLIGSSNRTLAEIIADLRKIYCGNIASEYLHIADSVERQWVQETIETTLLDLKLDPTEKINILELAIAADGLEKYLAAKYPGAKRFSLEGCDSMLVGLERLIATCTKYGVEEVVIAMAHRGRLNVLVNILGKIPRELFDQFENRHNLQLESGDVKYHQGFSSALSTPNGNVHTTLIYNPSHLEIVTPVASGSVCARQERRNDADKSQVLSIAMHGDAAFSGQGVAMEILNMSATRGYGIGGTIHIIINNQIGFTTSNPHDARSTLYCSDLGKMLAVPIFHVNADDPEAVWAVFNIALAYKAKFKKDVIIDLVGYRRMGHNEADEPSATQPVMYKIIHHHPSLVELYSKKLIANNDISEASFKQMVDEYRARLDQRDKAVIKHLADSNWKKNAPPDWTPYNVKDWRTPADTTVALSVLQQLATIRDTVPEDFVLDARVQKIVEARRKMTVGELLADWGYAETLAYATLLYEGYNVRLSGQDSARGTFFHRHAVWHDQNTDAIYTSLCHLNAPGKFTVIDSLLSESAVLGFEYGFSSNEPRCLTLWEAQFGDFANNAQVIVDQFISSGEQKWGRLSGLVMLLPHGYEGQGPEHSSARIERYLQLCAQHNMQVCIPSTPAQMFHLLRRQMLRPMRKPLIVITPKSLLRHKDAVSSLDELANGEFKVIVPDKHTAYAKIERVILCSGKVYYELDKARGEQDNIAIIRMEQLYPFPELELANELRNYTKTQTVIWCQEEPENQGGWYSMRHHVRNALLLGQELQYVGRKASAAPAVGYFSLHEEQQAELIMTAIGRGK